LGHNIERSISTKAGITSEVKKKQSVIWLHRFGNCQSAQGIREMIRRGHARMVLQDRSSQAYVGTSAGPGG